MDVVFKIFIEMSSRLGATHPVVASLLPLLQKSKEGEDSFCCDLPYPPIYLRCI
jgi:hypothetical protein